MNTLDIDAIRKHLEEQRDRLVDQLDELGATRSGDLRSDLDYGESFADAGAATAERTERLGLVDTLKGQLDEVEKALDKIEDGTYGICSRCGEPIPAARLEARPESTLCVACKSQTR
ncbi:MAG TPA: TraR/DksA C4-type zinc finger protein [Acidimicrobiia bacterium]|nr:TraR/DksA C4-type zinc finger protein [Acidimicrobiia bacterium]